MEMFTKRQEICLLFINESKEKDEDIVKFIITDWHDFHLSNKKSCISNIFIYCFFYFFKNNFRITIQFIFVKNFYVKNSGRFS